MVKPSKTKMHAHNVLQDILSNYSSTIVCISAQWNHSDLSGVLRGFGHWLSITLDSSYSTAEGRIDAESSLVIQ